MRYSIDIQLARDEKGIVYLNYNDFAKMYKLMHENGHKSITGKLSKNQIYKQFPLIHKCSEITREQKNRHTEENLNLHQWFLDGLEGPLSPHSKAQLPKRHKKNMLFTFKQNDEEISEEELFDIMNENPYKFNVNILRDVFSGFMSEDNEYCNINKLAELLSLTQLCQLKTMEDKKILIEALDKDKDGKVSFLDLERNIPFHTLSENVLQKLEEFLPKKTKVKKRSKTEEPQKNIRKMEPTACIINPPTLGLEKPILSKSTSFESLEEY